MKITKNDLKTMNLFQVAQENEEFSFIIEGTVWRLYVVKGELVAARYDELKTTEYSKLPKYIKVAIDNYNQDKMVVVEAIEDVTEELKEMSNEEFWKLLLHVQEAFTFLKDHAHWKVFYSYFYDILPWEYLAKPVDEVNIFILNEIAEKYNINIRLFLK